MTKYIKRYEVSRNLVKIASFKTVEEATRKARFADGIVHEVVYAVTARGTKCPIESKRVF